MSTPPTIRLYLLIARAAPRILIMRRGPTRFEVGDDAAFAQRNWLTAKYRCDEHLSG